MALLGQESATPFTQTTIGWVVVVISVLIAVVYAFVNVRAGRKEIGSEVELAPNRKRYFEDEELEGRKLDRTLTFGLVTLMICAVSVPLYWLNEPGRQAGASKDFGRKFTDRGAEQFATTADGGLNCAGCHGGMQAQGGVADYTITDAEGHFVRKVQWQAPALNTVLLRYNRAEVRYILDYGRPFSPMPAWGTKGGGPLNDQQVQNLIDYMESIQITPEEAQEQAQDALDTMMATREPECVATRTREALADAPEGTEVTVVNDLATDGASAPGDAGVGETAGGESAGGNATGGQTSDDSGIDDPAPTEPESQGGTGNTASSGDTDTGNEAAGTGTGTVDGSDAGGSIDSENGDTQTGADSEGDTSGEPEDVGSGTDTDVESGDAGTGSDSVSAETEGEGGAGATETEAAPTVEVDVTSCEGKWKTEGEALFNLGYDDGFAGGAYSCGRCHTQGWSYGDKEEDGGGAFGPALDDGAAVSQFPGVSLGFAQQVEFIVSGAEDGQLYGVQGQSRRGMMPGFGSTPEEKADVSNGEVGVQTKLPGEDGMLTHDMIESIVEYERSL